jgi:tRNA (guanine-N7-)-methyltransferase
VISSCDDDAPIATDLLPDWSGLAAGRPIELEIGPGHGGYALAFCREHPGRTLVAIEQRRRFAEELAARGRERAQSNLVVIQGDARLVTPRLFREGSLQAIHVHFPDPWWKRRHRPRRLLGDAMSLLLLRLLAPGGVVDLRTDVERYALEAARSLEAVGLENLAGPGRFAARLEEEIPSTREKRYLATGQPVWRLRLRRRG